MKDIARELGVSVVTVSKVLRGHADISTATRERVLKRVKELGYQPNASARSLVTGRSSLIGLIIPDLLHPFFAEVANGLSAVLRRKDYCVILASTQEQPELQQSEIEKLLAHRLDALVVAASDDNTELLKRVQMQGVPLVLIDRLIPGFSANFIGTDDYAVGVLATEHLINIGCKRIAHIRGSDNSVGKLRFEGYRDTLLKHDMPVIHNNVIQWTAVDVEGRRGGAEAMRRLLASHKRPDGVFCFNDAIAIGAMDEILGRGLSIPKDVAIVGCGNFHYSDTLRVPLTSIDQQSQRIGERTAKLLLNILDRKEHMRTRKIIIPPELVVRASTLRNKSRF
jgi:LacI family transcriptional regulator